jgi:hypothetical protein
MWNLSDEIIETARIYVAAVKRCEATGKGWHDEKRQLAHDDLMYALKRRNPELNRTILMTGLAPMTSRFKSCAGTVNRTKANSIITHPLSTLSSQRASDSFHRFF